MAHRPRDAGREWTPPPQSPRELDWFRVYKPGCLGPVLRSRRHQFNNTSCIANRGWNPYCVLRTTYGRAPMAVPNMPKPEMPPRCPACAPRRQKIPSRFVSLVEGWVLREVANQYRPSFSALCIQSPIHRRLRLASCSRGFEFSSPQAGTSCKIQRGRQPHLCHRQRVPPSWPCKKMMVCV